MAANPDQIRQASDRIRLWREKPQAMVRDVFGVTPDAWQEDILAVFPHQPRIAMKACAGPGKTSVLAWCAWNFLLTRPHPEILATAISGENLRDNLWKEMEKWRMKSPLLTECFEWQAERIFSREYPATWYMAARRWSKSATPEQQGNTLRGLHSDYVMIVVDESGGIPQSVMATSENIGSSAKEWHILQAGNPTHLEGPLYTACTTGRDLWHVVEITGDPDDPKRSPRVSIEWARNQIKMYGADNPWVLVNVFGKFPPSSMNSLIGPDEVNAALGKHVALDKYEHAPRVLGVDVGRFGDDPSIIYPRQGIVAFTPRELRNATSVHGAGVVMTLAADFYGDRRNLEAEAVFVDGTGGFGAGWIDVMQSLGRSPIDVQFAGKPNNPKYFNKRAEIWMEGTQWVKDGGALPNDPQIVAEMCTPTYTFKGDKIIVEDKDQVKMRLGRSPNKADALFTTFAQPVVADRIPARLSHLVNRSSSVDYNPLERER